MRLGVVILAAGASRRMGQRKLLLPWGDRTVLGHLLETWRGLEAEQMGVVAAFDDAPVRREVGACGEHGAQVIINPDPSRGMFSSIQCGARWTEWQATLTHFAIALGDQPQIQPALLRDLIQFAAGQPELICQPAIKGRAKHPVILPRREFFALASAGNETFRQFLEHRTVALLETDDSSIDVDLDTPADYAAARQRYLGAD